MIEYHQIKPKDVARRRYTLAQSAHCAQGVDNDNAGETNDPDDQNGQVWKRIARPTGAKPESARAFAAPWCSMVSYDG